MRKLSAHRLVRQSICWPIKRLTSASPIRLYMTWYARFAWRHKAKLLLLDHIIFFTFWSIIVNYFLNIYLSINISSVVPTFGILQTHFNLSTVWVEAKRLKTWTSGIHQIMWIAVIFKIFYQMHLHNVLIHGFHNDYFSSFSPSG